MKRLFTSIILLCVLPHVGLAQQGKHHLMSEWRDGDYIVRRYIIEDDTVHKANYELHYAINSSTTAPEYEHNDLELERLDRFFAELKNDTLRHISSITIAGYASPDGTTPFNAELARQRAEKLSAMLAKRYGLKGYNVTVTSHVEPWSATTESIEESKLKNRNDIVQIVNANEAPMVVDRRLKRESDAWSYLTSDVLPDMRRAVVTIAYTTDQAVVDRSYDPLPREVVVVEEVTERDKHDKKDRHDKRGKHDKRKHRVIEEWEGIIIDYGAADADSGR
ncbi:MAG: OmpA family protein [Alistipes sp.]|nr:OmpA family protein [Alistipes sp.]